MNKKIIVIFIGGYLPGEKYGGPVTSIENFTNQLSDYYEMKIICNDHDFKDKNRYLNIKSGWNRVGNADVFYTNESEYKSRSFYEIIKPFEKDIALFYLSGIYYIKMNYAVIKLAKRHNIPILLAPRGDLMKNTIEMKSKAKMIKKYTFLAICRITKLFNGVYFQSTSNEETKGLHKYLHVKDKRIFQLPNMPVLKHERSEYNKEPNKLKVLFISRLMVKKNPAFALEVIKEIDDRYKVVFDLYGPIEDAEYWNKCNTLIKYINSSKQNISVTYKGSLKPSEAKRIYDNYDCFIFPTASENYGHVIVEALFSECPVILSKGTTPFDDCDGNGSFVVSLDDRRLFTQRLEEIAAMGQEEYRELLAKNCVYIEDKFQVEKLKRDYLYMINKISNI